MGKGMRKRIYSVPFSLLLSDQDKTQSNASIIHNKANEYSKLYLKLNNTPTLPLQNRLPANIKQALLIDTATSALKKMTVQFQSECSLA